MLCFEDIVVRNCFCSAYNEAFSLFCVQSKYGTFYVDLVDGVPKLVKCQLPMCLQNEDELQSD